jgi:hypothetical protein
MKVLGWYSRSGEILVALDVEAAKQLEVWVHEHRAKGWIMPPVAMRLQAEILTALRDVPT